LYLLERWLRVRFIVPEHTYTKASQGPISKRAELIAIMM
jgi:hypothetical protein